MIHLNFQKLICLLLNYLDYEPRINVPNSCYSFVLLWTFIFQKLFTIVDSMITIMHILNLKLWGLWAYSFLIIKIDWTWQTWKLLFSDWLYSLRIKFMIRIICFWSIWPSKTCLLYELESRFIELFLFISHSGVMFCVNFNVFIIFRNLST